MTERITLIKSYDLAPGDVFSFTKGGVRYVFYKFSFETKIYRRALYNEQTSGAGCFDNFLFNRKVFKIN